MVHKRHSLRRARVLAMALILAAVMTAAPAVVAQSDRDAAWQQMLESITVLSNLSLVRDAVETLNEGGAEADALRADPGEYLRRGGLKLEETDLILMVDMEANPALTPYDENDGDGGDAFALTEVGIAFSGPESGVIIRRKIPVDAPSQSFEASAVDLTLWMEQSLEYIALVVNRLSEESEERMDFFLADPTEFFVQEAVGDRQLGTGITFSLLEQAMLVGYDLRHGDETDEPKILPNEGHSEPGTVTISIGYVSEQWALFVELTRISEF
jgi:hypothetical protein